MKNTNLYESVYEKSVGLLAPYTQAHIYQLLKYIYTNLAVYYILTTVFTIAVSVNNVLLADWYIV